MIDFFKFAKNKVNTNTLNTYQSKLNKLENILSPTIVEERPMNIAIMDVFSRLMMDRTVFIGDVIDRELANIVNSQLLYLSSVDDTPIKIIINSPGGDIMQGMSIIDIMRITECNIETKCIGIAASMASVLLCYGTHGERSITQRSKVMIHESSTFFEGKKSEWKAYDKFYRNLDAELLEIIVANTNLSMEEAEKEMEYDNWLSSTDAKAKGFIDKIV